MSRNLLGAVQQKLILCVSGLAGCSIAGLMLSALGLAEHVLTAFLLCQKKFFPAGYCVSDVMKRPGFFVVLTLNDVTNQNVNIIFVTCDDVKFYVVCRSYSLLLSYCVCKSLPV